MKIHPGFLQCGGVPAGPSRWGSKVTDLETNRCRFVRIQHGFLQCGGGPGTVLQDLCGWTAKSWIWGPTGPAGPFQRNQKNAQNEESHARLIPIWGNSTWIPAVRGWSCTTLPAEPKSIGLDCQPVPIYGSSTWIPAVRGWSCRTLPGEAKSIGFDYQPVPNCENFNLDFCSASVVLQDPSGGTSTGADRSSTWTPAVQGCSLRIPPKETRKY